MSHRLSVERISRPFCLECQTVARYPCNFVRFNACIFGKDSIMIIYSKPYKGLVGVNQEDSRRDEKQRQRPVKNGGSYVKNSCCR